MRAGKEPVDLAERRPLVAFVAIWVTLLGESQIRVDQRVSEEKAVIRGSWEETEKW